MRLPIVFYAINTLSVKFPSSSYGPLDLQDDEMDGTFAGLTEGNRLVAIISHVGELKDRIENQIIVKKDRLGGSKAEISIS